MLRWISLAGLVLVGAGIGLELLTVRTGRTLTGKPVVRVACAAWQKGELPFEAFIEAYRRVHPDLQVELKVLPEGSNNKLSMLWQRGQTPYDVIIAYADEEIHSFIRQGLLADVGQLLTAGRLAPFLPASLAGSTTVGPDGKRHHYMIPFTVEVMVLNARLDLLRQRGLTRPPKTWQQLRQMAARCKGFRQAGRRIWPIACDFSQSLFFGQNVYIPLLAAFTGGHIADSRGRLLIAGPQAERAFDEAKRWYLDGLVSESVKVRGQSDKDFMAGLAVFYPHWQSRGCFAMRDLPDAEIAIWPVPGAEQAGSLVSCYGALIPKPSPVKRQAARFAYQCLSQWIQPAVALSGKMPPVATVYERGFEPDPPWLQKLRRAVGADRPAWLQTVEQLYRQAELPRWMLDLRPALKKGYSFPDQLMWPKVNRELAIEFQRYLDGRYTTAAEALAALQKSVDALYERRRERGL
ncbi:MAG: ABC transporter substrate-binding protein [Phycisphaerae bacterium]